MGAKPMSMTTGNRDSDDDDDDDDDDDIHEDHDMEDEMVRLNMVSDQLRQDLDSQDLGNMKHVLAKLAYEDQRIKEEEESLSVLTTNSRSVSVYSNSGDHLYHHYQRHLPTRNVYLYQSSSSPPLRYNNNVNNNNNNNNNTHYHQHQDRSVV